MEIGILLTIVFVVLKLTHVIDWSWVWVFAPLWIGAIIMGIMFAIGGAAHFFLSRRGKKAEEHNKDTASVVDSEVTSSKSNRSAKRDGVVDMLIVS